MKVKVKNDKIDLDIPPYEKIKYKKEDEEHIKKMKEIIDTDDFQNKFRHATEEMVRCEIAYRGQKRSKLLKKEEKAKHFEKIENYHHEESIKKLNNAIKSFKDIRKKIKPETMKDLEKATKDEKELKKMKDKIDEALTEALLETDLTVEESEELMTVSNESWEHFKLHGFNKSLDKIESDLNELSSLRSNKQKNRGREHRSPVALWKWLIWVVWFNILLGILGGWVVGCFYLGPGACVAIGLYIPAFLIGMFAYIDWLWSVGC